MTTEYNTNIIRELLIAALGDEDLTTLCFDHFRSVYEHFASGMGRLVKIQLLLEYCRHHQLLDELLNQIKNNNPRQYARFEPKLLQSNQPQKPINNLEKTRLELTFPIDMASISPERQAAAISAAVGAIAGVLNIPVENVDILQVKIGSLIIQIELPSKSADYLIALWEAKDNMIQDLAVEDLNIISSVPSTVTRPANEIAQPELTTFEMMQLREFMRYYLTLHELQDLAFDLGVNHDIFKYNSKRDFIWELTSFFERRNHTGLLVAKILKLRTGNDFLVKLLAKLGTTSKQQKVVIILSDDLLSTFKGEKKESFLKNMSELFNVFSSNLSDDLDDDNLGKAGLKPS